MLPNLCSWWRKAVVGDSGRLVAILSASACVALTIKVAHRQAWSQEEWDRFISRANSLVKSKLDYVFRERISISTLPTLLIVAGFLPASYGWEKGLWWSAYLTLAIGLLLPCVSCTMAGFLQARNRARLDSVLSQLMNLCEDHSSRQPTGLRWATRFREVSMQRTNIWLEATFSTLPQ